MPKHPLQVFLEESDIKVRAYSGRAMFGQECLAVELDNNSMGHFVADLVFNIYMFCSIDIDKAEDQIDCISNAIGTMVTDSLGRGMIAYFPSVPYVKD